MTTPLRRFVRRYQTMLALVGMALLIAVPGLYRVQVISDGQKSQIRDQQGIQDCLVAYTVELTDALTQRDVVGTASRDALVEVDTALIHAIQHPSQDTVDQARTALIRHRKILLRLDHTVVANPYPAIQDCLP